MGCFVFALNKLIIILLGSSPTIGSLRLLFLMREVPPRFDECSVKGGKTSSNLICGNIYYRENRDRNGLVHMSEIVFLPHCTSFLNKAELMVGTPPARLLLFKNINLFI